MENFILGLFTGGSLILAIGPQNLFVIEQGLKKNFVFTITTICAASDVLLIFLGIFIYHTFESIPLKVEIILNPKCKLTKSQAARGSSWYWPAPVWFRLWYRGLMDV